MRTATTAKIPRQSLPGLMKQGPKWDSRITKYLYREKELATMRASVEFTATAGTIFEIGGFRLREIGSFGSIESGVLERVVEVIPPKEDEPFPDLLAELCEDTSGPLGKSASPELRERFDRERFDFQEYALIGMQPRLLGSKKRREQIRIINLLSRAVCGTDRPLSKVFAQMLADNIENLEPSAEL